MGDDLGSSVPHQILQSEAQLVAALERHDKEGLRFYNPLVYAVDAHCNYVCKFGRTEKPILFVGMSSSPYGMSQTGIPFGNHRHVTDYMGLDKFDVDCPKDEHPKLPVTGFDTVRIDQEGDRLWKYFESRYSSKEFFKKCYMTTYCPVMYVNDLGKEVPPPCLPHKLRSQVISACDLHIIDVVDILKPTVIIAVGGFTFEQVGKLFCSREVGPAVFPLLHPNPSNPAGNKKWTNTCNDQLVFAGVPQIIAGSEFMSSALAMNSGEKKKKRCSKDE